MNNMQRNPFFLPSGFEEQEKINILENKRDNKKRLKKIKARKRAEAKRVNSIRAGKVLVAGLHFKVHKIPKPTRLFRQIQYGFDLANWWGEQHGI